MERKKYIRDVYAKSYINRREKYYGFTRLDQILCKYVCATIPKGSKLLEVAIGTGFPIADYLQKQGYSIHGIDLSPILIKRCSEINKDIKCKVGDAENIEYPDNYFDVSYCFHSSWYFPNLNKVIDEMVRVTRTGGITIFDIQNRSNHDIELSYQETLRKSKRSLIEYFLNIYGIIFRKSNLNWHFLFKPVIYEVPTYPESIYEHLQHKNLTKYQVLIPEGDHLREREEENPSFISYPRLIFVIEK